MILLKNKEISASFCPSKGMNLMSLQKNGVEVIDPSTLPLFEERFAGLGSLIGPHFHHRPKDQIAFVPNESLFPHIARVKAKGILEPFSHGIARYAPWTVVQQTEQGLKATLSGDDLWEGVPLKTLEGFSFAFNLHVEMTAHGILMEYQVEAEKPSVLGFHYYYVLPASGGTVRSKTQPLYRVGDDWQPIPKEFLDRQGDLCFDARQPCDFGFISKTSEVFYDTESFSMKIGYDVNGPSSFQLYRPEGASYLCIEPLTERVPKHPIGCKQKIQLTLDILRVQT